MKKTIILTILTLLMGLDARGLETWVDLSNGMAEIDIRSIAVDPHNPSIIYAGSAKRLCRSHDQGRSWRTIYEAGGSGDRIHCVYLDPSDPKDVFVGTGQGVQRFRDGGTRWNLFFGRATDRAGSVYCISQDPNSKDAVWLGTGRGLFSVHKKTRQAHRIEGLPNTTVYSLITGGISDGAVYTATERGIFKSEDKGGHWQEVSTVGMRSEEVSADQEEVNKQFGIEEMPVPAFSNFIHAGQGLYVGSNNGILKNSGRAWKLFENQNIPTLRINSIASVSKTFYAATDRGIFRWDREKDRFELVDQGLMSRQVKVLFYSQPGDFLLAGTPKGLFRLSHPETTGVSLQIEPTRLKEMDGILSRFTAEPTIRQIQNAAILYAEVHPRKIEQWRSAAARKAILPTVSVGGKLSRDRNIDIDRGGTNDPDKFIIGPDEKNFDWSLSLSWDLGELIWNNDQTAIDSRSKLMAELRDDILNEVTHLYFERRRLQVEMLTESPEVSERIEKEIRLEELTAGIDGLTGGFLSKSLGKEAEGV